MDAFRLLKVDDHPRLLTLYLEQGEPNPWEWSEEHLPEDVRTGIEWLGISLLWPAPLRNKVDHRVSSSASLVSKAEVLISECGYRTCDNFGS